MNNWDIIGLLVVGLLVVALLTTYMALRLWQRREKQRPEWTELAWKGHGIDVTDVIDKVERVRADFSSALRSRPNAKQGLLALAKRAIRRLSYFRHRAEQNSTRPEHMRDDREE